MGLRLHLHQHCFVVGLVRGGDPHNLIVEVAPAYRNFAAWLGMDQRQHGVISFNWDLQAELRLTQESIRWRYTLWALGSRLSLTPPFQLRGYGVPDVLQRRVRPRARREDVRCTVEWD